jgi:hypothetical protein
VSTAVYHIASDVFELVFMQQLFFFFDERMFQPYDVRIPVLVRPEERETLYSSLVEMSVPRTRGGAASF